MRVRAYLRDCVGALAHFINIKNTAAVCGKGNGRIRPLFWVKEKMETLKETLQREKFFFKKKFGQNFISDSNLLSAIVADAGVGKEDTVIEIGCGGGTLTAALAECAGKVIGYEIDRDLQPVLSHRLAEFNNVELRFGDIMKQELSEIEQGLSSYVVVANLPYYITTPVIMKFVEHSAKMRRMIIMVQEEVADRLCASPGTEAYGSVTAAITVRGKAKVTRKVPRKMFYPVPNVDSAVVEILLEKTLPEETAKAYRAVVRAAFASRRKTLLNNLMQSFHISREEGEKVIAACNLAPMVRGETLDSEQFLAIAAALHTKIV